ncbi:protein prenyltransferase alpha subunit repeat-containing protein 1-like [Planococcus citri]|uniref:protein prenyltransferase alpha subunit repeat-containing protein 1-like n=1 Tax=Planococcus citri TaxID=170843 RepID=UPI0031F9607E
MPLNYDLVFTEIWKHLRDSQLKSFDVIFKPEENDSLPVICIEQNLGIESWCIKDLYVQAFNIVFKLTSVGDSIRYDASILILLLLNPNIKTLWNKRKSSMLAGKSNVPFELNFTKLVLTYKPKSQDALNYRKWLLKVYNHISYTHFVSNDLNLILDAASRHTNNHVVWDYGIWYLNSADTQTTAKLSVELWDQTTAWINRNISDYSGLHFRQFIIKKLISEDIVQLVDNNFKKRIILTGFEFIGSVLKISDENVIIEYCQKFTTSEYSNFYLVGILLADFELNENLISFYDNHEALWNHRRFLCYHFLSFLPTVLPDDSKKLFASLVKNIHVMSASFLDVNESNLFEFLFLKIHCNFLDKCRNPENQYHSTKYINWLKKSKILNLSSLS